MLLSVSLAASEVAARLVGYAPWSPTVLDIQIEPGGTLSQRHPVLGYRHLPGAFTVTLDSALAFRVTHRPSTLRVTKPAEEDAVPRPDGQIWAFGCSFTHGWALDDDETYPWLLQEAFPTYDVVNFGVSGYGTIHSLLQLREALETSTPRLVVLAYAGFHDARNTFSRNRRKGLAAWTVLGPLDQPFASLGEDGELEYGFATMTYDEVPLMRRSALVHAAESWYTRQAAKRDRSREVTRALIREMAEAADARGVPFLLANIQAGQEIEPFADGLGIAYVDLSVDLSDPRNNNLPYDSHPSAAANVAYADALARAVRREVGR